MSVMLEIKLSLAEEIVRQLQEQAQQWGVSEEVVVEQALGLLFARSDPSPTSDYWFSVSTMREDWEAMPDDWYVAEANKLTDSYYAAVATNLPASASPLAGNLSSCVLPTYHLY